MVVFSMTLTFSHATVTGTEFMGPVWELMAYEQDSGDATVHAC